jgi:hypothetical protein
MTGTMTEMSAGERLELAAPDNDIAHVSAPIIIKYVTDLQRLGLL